MKTINLLLNNLGCLHMFKRLQIILFAVAIITLCSVQSYAADNWAEQQIPTMVDAFLKKMDPTVMRMEAQITAMDSVSKNQTNDYQKMFNKLILFKTISLAASDVEDLAPWGKSNAVGEKMHVVKSIAEAHYTTEHDRLAQFITWINENKRKELEGTKDGRAALIDFDSVADILDDLDDEIEDAYEDSKYRPTQFREV